MTAGDVRAPLLARCDDVDELLARRVPAVDAGALAAVLPIIDEVRREGLAALHRHADRFGELPAGGALWLDAPALRTALVALAHEDRERLERIAARIKSFARAQRDSLAPLTLALAGGSAGHTIAAVEVAGCYAPGGRHPLASSVLMTALTARVAGVTTVIVASPRPSPLTLAAAALAQADALICAGGAQAIAALAYGAAPLPACDLVCGPGNQFVTAAKYAVSKDVAIDLLAGPSELLIVADASADPRLIAADLIAQAEHDPSALPMLIVVARADTGRATAILAAVEAALEKQLDDLPTASTARAALARGGVLRASDLDEAAVLADRLAPEHLALHLAGSDEAAARFHHCGSLFLGPAAGEVLGDYGAGPNHTLPTGGLARARGGLSVLTFLRTRTWLRVDDPAAARPTLEDAEWFAEREGLQGHARSARRRLPPPGGLDTSPAGSR